MPAPLRLSRLILDEHARLKDKFKQKQGLAETTKWGFEFPDFVSTHDQITGHRVLLAYGHPTQLLLPKETFEPHDFHYWLLRQPLRGTTKHYWNYQATLPGPRGEVQLSIRHSRPTQSKEEHVVFMTHDANGRPNEVGRIKFSKGWSEINLNAQHPLHENLLKALVNFVKTPPLTPP